jgi:intracellular sulfur oxidation DsrE/DsrF family protein
MQITTKLFRLAALMLLVVVNTLSLSAQTTQPSPTREERMKKQESNMVFPLVKGSYLSGVIPVEDITSKPDPNKEVKLIFDFTQSTSTGNQANKINEGLEEVARILNLHIAAGVKKEKLKAVIVFHAGSILSVMKNDFYQQKYKATNPNMDMLGQLSAAGVDLVICGQSLALREIPHPMVLPQVKIAYAAKTTLSKYLGEGYVEFPIKEE